VRRIGRGHGSHGFRQIIEDFGKQCVVEMHADGLARLRRAQAMQAQRNSCLVEVGVEARGPLERPDIELVRIFKRYFRFVRDRLGHGTHLPLIDPMDG
jgi:hypothetical protein